MIINKMMEIKEKKATYAESATWAIFRVSRLATSRSATSKPGARSRRRRSVRRSRSRCVSVDHDASAMASAPDDHDAWPSRRLDTGGAERAMFDVTPMASAHVRSHMASAATTSSCETGCRSAGGFRGRVPRCSTLSASRRDAAAGPLRRNSSNARRSELSLMSAIPARSEAQLRSAGEGRGW